MNGCPAGSGEGLDPFHDEAEGPACVKDRIVRSVSVDVVQDQEAVQTLLQNLVLVQKRLELHFCGIPDLPQLLACIVLQPQRGLLVGET